VSRFSAYWCLYCKRSMFVTRREYKENPYCCECLHERIAKAAAEDPLITWKKLDSGYIEAVRLSDLQWKR